VPQPSLEQRFLSYLRWRGAIRWTNYTRCAAPFIRETSRALFAREWAGLECVAAQCKTYLAGVPVRAMDSWLGWFMRHSLGCIPEALNRVNWHSRQGHQIVLLSGTLAPIAAAVAQLLSASVHVCATQLECDNGRFTGGVRGEAICGPAKARALERMAAEFSLDLNRSYAYGDSFADRWMLGRVGRPFAVQARESCSRRLVRLASRRGWPVLRWSAVADGESKSHPERVENSEKRKFAEFVSEARSK
jgi:HAD superfamily hydrolase (TIGR01490 family)